jgi:hypothetical protein
MPLVDHAALRPPGLDELRELWPPVSASTVVPPSNRRTSTRTPFRLWSSDVTFGGNERFQAGHFAGVCGWLAEQTYTRYQRACRAYQRHANGGA